MDNLAWAAIFRQIPEEKQNGFSLITSAGTEIAVQSFLRLEYDFAVIKGRLSGSQEAGRVFFVPYKNIDFFGTLYPIKDADYHDLFGSLIIAPQAATPVAVTATPPEDQAPPAVVPSAALPQPTSPAAKTPEPATTTASGGSRTPLRSEALERFRARPTGPSSSASLPNPRLP